MAKPTHVADLFLREPRQWGLRGDPWLWRAMRDRLEDVPLPADRNGLQRLLEDAFRQEVGQDIATADDRVFIDRFAHGGMTSGTIDVTWWRTTGLPVLLNR